MSYIWSNKDKWERCKNSKCKGNSNYDRCLKLISNNCHFIDGKAWITIDHIGLICRTCIKDCKQVRSLNYAKKTVSCKYYKGV